MAPRGRLKKGQKRIDAAIDALGQLGFSRDVVCKTVSELLKVYDGDDGWPFIEEASYKLVIESILEEQEKESKEDERETRGDAMTLEVCEHGEASSHFQALANTSAGPTDGYVNWKDISCTDHESWSSLHGQRQQLAAGGSSNASLDVGPSHSQQHSLPPRPRRKPCYGWISEDEKEEDDPPGDVVGFSQKHEKVETAGGSFRERKRISRWDVKPLGM